MWLHLKAYRNGGGDKANKKHSTYIQAPAVKRHHMHRKAHPSPFKPHHKNPLTLMQHRRKALTSGHSDRQENGRVNRLRGPVKRAMMVQRK